ncbi:MAG: AMP-binding protein, partial [bacterium]|nr:AMP-binding protein [bacterium]
MRGERINFPLYTSISFDLTVTSIFTPVLTGNAVVVFEVKDKQLPMESIINDPAVGAVKLTPSHLKLIKEVDILNHRSNLKRLIVGGEKLDSRLAVEISRKFNGSVEIYNEYGPTEATVGCMIYKFDPTSRSDSGGSVSIGVPAANTGIFLLDRHQRPVPGGVAGEIYISGAGIARGYLNQPEMTNSKFQITSYKQIPNSKSQITNK